MKLRPRLAVTTLAVSLPMVLGLIGWDARSKQRAAEEELIEFTRSLAISPGWIERCEAQPVFWRGGQDSSGKNEPWGRPPPPPPPEPRGQLSDRLPFHPFPHSHPATFTAYGADLTSRNRHAP